MDNTRLKNAQAILENLDAVIDQLEQVADHDGVTAEEELLLLTIHGKIQEYQNLLEEVLADDIVTRDEESKMRSFELEIIRSSIRVAQKDWEFSDDETIILDKLQELLMQLDQLKD